MCWLNRKWLIYWENNIHDSLLYLCHRTLRRCLGRHQHQFHFPSCQQWTHSRCIYLLHDMTKKSRIQTAKPARLTEESADFLSLSPSIFCLDGLCQCFSIIFSHDRNYFAGLFSEPSQNDRGVGTTGDNVSLPFVSLPSIIVASSVDNLTLIGKSPPCLSRPDLTPLFEKHWVT